jgi:hypothetical protein
LRLHHAIIGRKGANDAVRAVGVIPPGFDGSVTIWVHPKGMSSVFQDSVPVPLAQGILNRKSAIVAMDCLRTGEQATESPWPVDQRYAGYTYGYNRPILAERVRDVLTMVAFAKTVLQAKVIRLVGLESAGPWALIARAQCGDAIARTAVDINGFRFDQIQKTNDEMMLPGALKYGGLPAFAALCAPGELYLHNHQGTGIGRMTKDAYAAADAADKVHLSSEQVPPEKTIDWLMR